MTLRLYDNHASTSALRELRKLPIGPQRMRRLVKLLRGDIAGMPLAIVAPEEVREAQQAFEAAVAFAEQVAGEIQAAEDKAKAAARDDVKRAADALRDGKTLPKITQVKAAEAVPAAVVTCEAAERLLEEAHETLVDAVYSSWADWRRELVDGAAAVHEAAAALVSEAVAAVAEARERYDAVGRLDAEVRARYADVRKATDAEKRANTNWYELTHSAGKPLHAAAVPGQSGPKGRPVMVDLAAMLASVEAAVTTSVDFGPAHWLPPTDPRHDDALAEPLDLTEPWLRRAVAWSFGSSRCAVCGGTGADVVMDGRGLASDGGLVLVHTRCRQDVDKAEAKAARREGRRREGGLSPSDPRYGQAAAESAAQELAEEERLERGGMTSEEFNRAAFPGQ